MIRKRDRRANALEPSPDATRLIQFGSPRHPGDRCSYTDLAAEFALCLECSFNRGARGNGILCAHRFGLDPTLVDGIPTQFDGDGIRRLEDDDLAYEAPPQ
jgi:hypothetical protein